MIEQYGLTERVKYAKVLKLNFPASVYNNKTNITTILQTIFIMQMDGIDFFFVTALEHE